MATKHRGVRQQRRKMAKKSGKNQPTGKNELVVERRLLCLRLRQECKNYREISEILSSGEYGDRFACSYTQVFRDVQAAIAEIRDELKEPAVAVLELELMRIDSLLAKWLPIALDPPTVTVMADGEIVHKGRGNAEAAAAIVDKLMARRSRYLGLDAPKRVMELDPGEAEEMETLSDKQLDMIIAGDE